MSFRTGALAVVALVLLCSAVTAATITTKDEVTFQSTTDGKVWNDLTAGTLDKVGSTPISIKLSTQTIKPVIQVLPSATVVVGAVDTKTVSFVQYNTAGYQGYYSCSESLTMPWTAYWSVDTSRKDPWLIYATFKPRSVYTAPISQDQLTKNIVDPVKAGDVPSIVNIMEMVNV